MSKARIRWIAGISLVAVALLTGGGYFLQVWRTISLAKAEENATGKDAGPTPAKPAAVQPILADDEEDPPPEPELGSFERSKFTSRKKNGANSRTEAAVSDFATGDEATEYEPPRRGAELSLEDDGEFEPRPAPPAAFGGANRGGGFDEPAEEFEPAPSNQFAAERPPARFTREPAELEPTAPRALPGAMDAVENRTFAPAAEDAGEELAPVRSGYASRPPRGALPAARIEGPQAEGQGAPGPRQLEGLQAPSLALEKAAPGEIQVGKPATFQIKVRNVGPVEAHEVVVYDEVPRGTRFVEATPQAGRAADGALTWRLGTLRPGEEQTISLQVMPIDEGEIGSVARVSFEAQASARTISTRPQLKVEHTAPPKVLIGQGVTFSIKISNPGTGAATNVVLEEDVPDGLSHPAGNELEFELGTLRPGESKSLELTLKAEKPGLITNTLLVRADAGLSVEDQSQVEVIAPQLEVDLKGPSRRFLDRQATYVFSVANRGTAAAKEVELVAFLPKGFKFVETNNAGQYDPQKHAVYWSLAELPPTESGSVQLIALPVEAGEQKLRLEGRADLGLADAREQAVLVESVAHLLFDVIDSADPIEVGSDTIYQVRIVNQGTKAATNVRLAASLPPELQPLAGEGPTKAAVEPQRVQFEPLARLAPKSEAVYRIQVRGKRPGDPRIRVQLTSDELQSPVTKEEATKVYSDQ